MKQIMKIRMWDADKPSRCCRVYVSLWCDK